jgi:hypothetical protein
MNIDIPNSPNVNPCCINNEGLVAGWYEAEKRHGSSTTSGKVSGYSAHGFVWQKGAAQTLDYPGAAATFLNGINNRGVAIGYYDVAIGYYDDANSVHHAVTYSLASSAWTVLPKIRGYPSADGVGINDGGTAMGEADGFPFGHVAWIWHPDSQSYSYFTAPGPSEASTHPSGMSADGKIVGHITTQRQLGDRTYGFLKDHDQYQDINVPGAVATLPSGINNSTTIAGWILTSTDGHFGFVRTSDGVFTLVNYPGSTWTHVSGINDHGTVCGYWYNPASGHVQGFVAYPR